jgi:hypothetical protein
MVLREGHGERSPLINKGIGERIGKAILDRKRAEYGDPTKRPLTEKEIGRRIAEKLKIPVPPTTTIARWLTGAMPKHMMYFQALAYVLEVDPGWLAFGGVDGHREPLEPSIKESEYRKLKRARGKRVLRPRSRRVALMDPPETPKTVPPKSPGQ